MKRLWIGLALMVAWVLVGWTQVGPGVLGPFLATSDAQGEFFADLPLPFLAGVAGELVDVVGKPLAQIPFEVYLEPRPGLAEIVGVGNVEAVWVVVQGFDPERVTDFTILVRSKPSLELGRVTLQVAPSCTDCTSQIRIVADDCSVVHFLYRHCSGGRWGPWQLLLRATKGTELPKEVGKECTWVVVVQEDKGKLTYTFYHSDGRTWGEKGTLMIPIVVVWPVQCESCQYVVVDQGGGHRLLYHCERLGVWKLIGEWGRPEPTPVRRVPPPPPPPP